MPQEETTERGELEATEVLTDTVLAVQAPFEARPETTGPAVNRALQAAICFVERRQLTIVGPPRVLYYEYGPEGVSGNAVLPIAPSPPAQTPSVYVSRLAGRKALRFTHRGPYSKLAQTYDRIVSFAFRHGIVRSADDWPQHMPIWEEYADDPQAVPEADLLTHIFVPIR